MMRRNFGCSLNVKETEQSLVFGTEVAMRRHYAVR